MVHKTREAIHLKFRLLNALRHSISDLKKTVGENKALPNAVLAPEQGI